MIADNPHYFVAIPLPDSIKQNLSGWQHELKEVLPYKQWTQQSDFHITLKFLGGASGKKISELGKKLKVIKELPLFEIEIAGLHTFGKPSQPRVLWAGVQKTDSLLKLQGIVANLAHSAGFSKEDRAYQPHITIGKKWNHQEAGKAVQHYIEAYKQKKMQFYANQIVLYRIEPNHVPKYHVHEVYSLLGRGDYGPVD